MNIVITDSIADLRRLSDGWRAEGLCVGLVPTMGALHAGHASLMRQAKRDCDRVIVSIFVNPTQFGHGEDYDRYPRKPEADLDVCRQEGVDAVFIPGPKEMYPDGFVTTIHVGGSITADFEAKARPGHFDGVATVVTKLWWCANPHRCYFGAKDAQQCAVVNGLSRDLGGQPEIVICPTVRDDDGLALSSRNQYLDAEARGRAIALPRAIAAVHLAFARGERRASRLKEVARQALGADAEVDYLALVDPESFTPLEAAEPGSQFLVAATIAGTRLIDEISLGVDAPPGGIMAGVGSDGMGA